MALTTAIFTLKPPPPLCSYLFFLLLCIFGFYTLHHPHQRNPYKTLDYYHDLFLSTSDNSTIATYLRALTLHPHLAGTAASLDTTHYVYAQFQTLGLKTHQTHYETLLSYPVHSSLAAHFNNGTRLYFNLSEKGVAPDVVPPYHAYSPSGSAYAKVVFVNFGREEDYLALGVVGVNVSGCVVIARKGGGLSRGGVVRVAEANGALAVLLYTEGDKGGGVERGTVMSGVGDPQSPGWAGVEGGEKLPVEDSEVMNRFPKIPSMPLSLENADVILGSLAGPAVPQRWRDSLPSRVSRVGPGPTIVNFTYQAEKKVATIQNVFATIKGIEEPDRYVLLGNHRDAWTYGAVDPNSGTAALLDVARRYALLMHMGWNPRRTIVFCSWDAEEFGMVGSTEWVEQNLVNLDAKAVTYLNVDCAVQGPGFFAAATPQLDNLLIEVTKKVEDPDMEGATVYEELTTTNRVINIQRLSGVESDFAPFLQYAGIPSIDIYYGGDFPVYHTAFDSYDWITTYADPLFQRHVAVARVWGLLALRLADDSVLPFDYLSYADQLQRYKDVLSSLLDGSISLEPLTRSIQELASAAKVAEDEAKRFRDPEIMDDFGVLKLRALNDRLMRAERGFLDADGLQGRQWFKHLIYGPHGDYENKLTFFPGIADAIHQSQKMIKRDGNAVIQSEIWRAARAIGRAASALTGELT